MSRIRANTITNQNANGAPNFPDGITVSGVVTATVSNSTLGTLAVTGNATVGGTLGVGGTITYEDVTNVDSVGIITARSGIKIGPTAGVAGTFFADGSYITAGIITATTFHGSGANLTGIDATKIQTGTTTVETTTSRIDNKIGNVGILTVTASGAKVTGIVTVFGQGIDYQWQGGTATAWWKSEDMVNETSWPAAKGGADANFINGNGGSNGISYIASDSTFNNQKTMSMSSGGAGSLRTYNENAGQWWNGTEAFTMLLAMRKDEHHSGSSYGDGFFVFNQNTASSGGNTGGWSFDVFGDHTWGGGLGEMFGNTGGLFENNYMNFSYPWKGILMVRMAANFDYGELSVHGGTSWHSLEMRHSGPSSLGTNFRSISLLNFACESSSSHNGEGRVAECAYFKGKRLGGAELDAITRHWCEKFQF
mgnify:CR=1 FL=1